MRENLKCAAAILLLAIPTSAMAETFGSVATEVFAVCKPWLDGATKAQALALLPGMDTADEGNSVVAMSRADMKISGYVASVKLGTEAAEIFAPGSKEVSPRQRSCTLTLRDTGAPFGSSPAHRLFDSLRKTYSLDTAPYLDRTMPRNNAPGSDAVQAWHDAKTRIILIRDLTEPDSVTNISVVTTALP